LYYTRALTSALHSYTPYCIYFNFWIVRSRFIC